jgi:hypothetical protein
MREFMWWLKIWIVAMCVYWAQRWLEGRARYSVVRDYSDISSLEYEWPKNYTPRI